MIDIEIEQTQDIENSSLIPINIYKSIPDNLDLLFSTYKKYETKKIKFLKDELFVSNLDRYLKYDDIFDFLNQFGEIKDLKLNYKVTDKNKKFFAGNCFVKFKDLSKHDQLIAKSNQYSLRGRKVIFSERIQKIQSLDDIEKSCWFCFSNPNIEKDLIIYDFKHFYIAYPKGPIDNFHLIISPKLHIKNYLAIPEDLLFELDFILRNLKKFYSDNNLEYIIFEKNLPYNDEKAKHMILNFIGIKKDLSFDVFDRTLDILKKNKLKFETHDANEWDIQNLKYEKPDCNYHYLDIPSGLVVGKIEKRTKFVIYHENRNNEKNKIDFSDFSRMIICDVIGKKENINWKVINYISLINIKIFFYKLI